MTGRPVAACGTLSGYAKHLREKTGTCDRCRKARREYQADRKARLGGGRYMELPPNQPCGTYGAYLRHRRSGEEACAPCKEAARASGYARKHPGEPVPPRGELRREKAVCGTVSGAHRHRREGEAVCGGCRAAEAAYGRLRADAKRKEARNG